MSRLIDLIGQLHCDCVALAVTTRNRWFIFVYRCLLLIFFSLMSILNVIFCRITLFFFFFHLFFVIVIPVCVTRTAELK